MVTKEKIDDLKTRCKKNKGDPVLDNELKLFLNSLGFDTDTNKPDYYLERKTINDGKPWKTDAFCLRQGEGILDKNEFYDRLNILKQFQNTLPQTFKVDKGGFGFQQDVKGWCSTSPNTIKDAVNVLQKKKGIKVKPNLDGCDFMSGVTKQYMEFQADEISEPPQEGIKFIKATPEMLIARGLMSKPEGSETEQVEKEVESVLKSESTPTTPSRPTPVDLKKLKAIIPNQTTEIFIPLDQIAREDAWKVDNLIRDDGYKPSKEMLVTYYTEGWDQLTNKKVKKRNDLLVKCNKEGKIGLCAPIGLANNVKKLLEEANFDIEIDDQRQLPPPHPFKMKEGIELRKYQDNIVKEAKEKGSGLVEVATGGGKTVIATGIISEIGQDTAFVVPNNSLFYNAKTQIESYVDPKDVNIGQIGGLNVDYKDDPNKTDINIISLPLASMAINQPDRIDPKKREVVLKALKNANMVIFDETHHVPANTYQKVAQFTPAKYRFGLSATPFRDDGKTLEIIAGVGGTLGHKINAQDLIKIGFLTPPEIYVIDNQDIDPDNDGEIIDNLKDESCKINEKTKMHQRIKETDYPTLPSRYTPEKKDLHRYIEKATVECNKTRNERIVDLVKKLDQFDKTKVVFVNSVEHGKKLQEMLEKEGVYTELLTGDTESKILKKLETEEGLSEEEIKEEEEKEKEFNKKRSILFEKMKDGNLKTIIATDKIMGEGVDIPAIDSLVLTDMRKSRVNALQMVGRALRKKEGKKKALVFDFKDPVEYLEDWMDSRHEVWRNEDFPLIPMEYDQIDTKLEDALGKPTVDITKRKAQDQKIINRNKKQREYEDMKIPDLKTVAKSKGIKTTGLKKDEVIAKLIENEG